ncbi:MAG: DUF1656 domain-containing protein [Planctomycetia bacterium]|nr:DUF1656 domain-containing protein [Planctomycetia bacterium]
MILPRTDRGPRFDVRRTTLRTFVAVASVMMLGGCDPIIDIGGAFFPGWIFAAIGGLVSMLLVRQILHWTGIEQHLLFRGFAYLGVFIAITVLLWYAFFLT